jgi:hypothetical protein
MKAILLSLFTLLCLYCFSQKEAPKHLIHFKQTTPSSPGAIPYGANPKAGHYVYFHSGKKVQ